MENLNIETVKIRKTIFYVVHRNRYGGAYFTSQDKAEKYIESYKKRSSNLIQLSFEDIWEK